jgi:hypothetical protein
LNRHLPGCRVILHKARFADSYRNAQDEIVSFSEGKLKLNRTANWNAAVLEDMFVQQFRCDVISLLDHPVLGDEQHVWGIGALHFERSYYTRFSEALRTLLDAAPAPPGQSDRV